jgi:8-oxo-dGTP pyrophosphatase MutT (NUDIX family)
VEHQNRYLLVHESPNGLPVFNQPAGHLNQGESLIAAAVRETREETGWEVSITDYLGSYRYVAPNGSTYLRHGFAATPLKHYPEQALDVGIIEALWLSYEDIIAHSTEMRSPMVIQLLDDYRANKRYPLALLHEDG